MKTIVIKLGGSALENSKTQQELILLVGGLRKKGHRVVVVHGGGPAINRALEVSGLSWSFINGQRKTSPEMMSVIEHVLATKVNSSVVNTLAEAGIPALGMSGAADKLLHCEQASKELGQVGTITRVNLLPIIEIIRSRVVIVIAPIGIGKKAERYNINADRAAAKIASALKANDLIFLTDQEGVLDENKNLVQKASPRDVQRMIESGCIYGGMRVKAEAMVEALNEGVRSIRVLHAHAASCIVEKKNVGTTLSHPRSHYQPSIKSEYASRHT